MSVFKEILSKINEEIDNQLDIEILEETKDSITIWDGEDCLPREYTIYNPNIINADWIKRKIICTPSLKKIKDYKIDIDILSKFLSTLDKNLFLTLRNIILCNDTEEDFDFIHDELGDDFSIWSECSDIPSNNQLGVMWYEASTVLINIGSIIESTNELLNDGNIYNWEVNTIINYEILKTIIHELRHLEQNNPYLLSNDLTFFDEDDEQDAEIYADYVLDENIDYILKEK